DARVVDHDVEPAEARDRLAHAALDARLVGDVGLDRERALAELRRQRARCGGVDVRDDGPRALADEALGNAAADPLRAAGDDDDLALVPHLTSLYRGRRWRMTASASSSNGASSWPSGCGGRAA